MSDAEPIGRAAAQRRAFRRAVSYSKTFVLPWRWQPFIVCAAGRSGTGYASRVFTALGHPCGHEGIFRADTEVPRFRNLQGDSSWLALPHLASFADRAVIYHQVRHPMAVVRSLAGIHMLSSPSVYLDFVERCRPSVVCHEDELRRCMAYWNVWNEDLLQFEDGVTKYVRYRIEEADRNTMSDVAASLGRTPSIAVRTRRLAKISTSYNSRARKAGLTLADLPECSEKEHMMSLAARFGYQLID